MVVVTTPQKLAHYKQNYDSAQGRYDAPVEVMRFAVGHARERVSLCGVGLVRHGDERVRVKI
jgi:hypothetical protein